MDTESLEASLRCQAPVASAHGVLQVTPFPPLSRFFRPGSSQRVQLLHAKRDGQVCFFYADQITGLDVKQPATSGQPGDVFFFGGDPALRGGEARGQIIIVYGPDNLFVAPFDRGFQTRGYQNLGRLEPAEGLQRIGEELWRHGSREVDLEVLK